MKFLILFSLVFVLLTIVSVDQDAFAVCSMNESCHAWEKSSDTSSVDGLKYSLDSPDL